MLADNQQPESVETVEAVEGAEVEKVELAKTDADPAAEKEKAKRRLSDRNRELTYRLRQTERELEAERKKTAELAVKAPKVEPDPEDYSDRQKYTEDREAWKEAERGRIRAEESERLKTEARQAEARQTLEKQKDGYIKGRADAIKEDPKFHEYEKEIDKVVDAFEAPEIQDLILAASKHGPQIVSYLGKNPDELEEIAGSSPRERIFRMGKLIAKLEAKLAPSKISSAPNPTRSEKGSAPRVLAPSGKVYTPEKESFQAYAKRINGIK